MARTWLRWMPAAVVPAVIAVGVLAVPLQAGAAVDLPDKTPGEVLALVGSTTVEALSGTIEQTSALGLPDLSGMGATGAPGGSGSGDAATAAATSALEFLTGSHTARIYVDGPTKARVQVLDRLAERDVIRNGDEVWFYSSDINAATRVTVPVGAMPGEPAVPGEPQSDDATAVPSIRGGVQTPGQLAERFLAAVDRSTTVTVGEDTDLAGRTAYVLVLTPKASTTLIGSVSIAVDSETGMPLRVSVQARGQEEPAFEVGYTAITLGAPSADLFSFTPPAGATITEQAPLPQPLPDGAKPAQPEAPTEPGQPDTVPGGVDSPVTVSGAGWDAVVELRGGMLPPELIASPLFSQLTTAVTGGRVLSTTLVSVFLADDGRVFAGSVPVDRLQAAAAAQ